MNQGDRRYHCIDRLDASAQGFTRGRNATKCRRRSNIEGQYPFLESFGFKAANMAFKPKSTPARRKSLGAKAQLCEDRRANIKGRYVLSIQPRDDSAIRLWPPRLRDHIGIKQNHSKSGGLGISP